jgi:hypothetical protein
MQSKLESGPQPSHPREHISHSHLIRIILNINNHNLVVNTGGNGDHSRGGKVSNGGGLGRHSSKAGDRLGEVSDMRLKGARGGDLRALRGRELRLASRDGHRVAGGGRLQVVGSGGFGVADCRLGVVRGGFRVAGDRAESGVAGGRLGKRLEVDRLSFEVH